MLSIEGWFLTEQHTTWSKPRASLSRRLFELLIRVDAFLCGLCKHVVIVCFVLFSAGRC